MPCGCARDLYSVPQNFQLRCRLASRARGTPQERRTGEGQLPVQYHRRLFVEGVFGLVDRQTVMSVVRPWWRFIALQPLVCWH